MKSLDALKTKATPSQDAFEKALYIERIIWIEKNLE